jgi:hypothetical protein
MAILHDAAGPAVLAVNMPSPSSLLSGCALGLFAMVFAEDRARWPGPSGPDRTPPGAPPPCIPKLARQERPMTGRPPRTAFTRARSGGQPKGARCLP